MNELDTQLEGEFAKFRKERLQCIWEKHPEFYERVFGIIKLETQLDAEFARLRKERLQRISEEYPEFYKRVFEIIKLETIIKGYKDAIKMYNAIVKVYFMDRSDKYEGIERCMMC